MPIPATTSTPAAISTTPPPILAPAAKPTGGNQLPKVVIKDHQYNPVRNLLFKIRAHLKIINLTHNVSYFQPEQPQPVSPTGSCSSDSIILHYCELLAT